MPDIRRHERRQFQDYNSIEKDPTHMGLRLIAARHARHEIPQMAKGFLQSHDYDAMTCNGRSHGLKGADAQNTKEEQPRSLRARRQSDIGQIDSSER